MDNRAMMISFAASVPITYIGGRPGFGRDGRRAPTARRRGEAPIVGYFLKSAGVVAVYVDTAGAIGAVDAVGITAPLDCSLLCCGRGNHAKAATLAAARMRVGTGQAGALAAVREAAAELGIGLTPHETVIRRAFAAVETVNLKVADMQHTGGE
jgi:hypothetical protein